MTFPGTIKVRITHPLGGTWFATSLLHKSTPEKTVAFLNKRSAATGLLATYALASQQEYDAYRGNVKPEA